MDNLVAQMGTLINDLEICEDDLGQQYKKFKSNKKQSELYDTKVADALEKQLTKIQISIRSITVAIANINRI